MYSKFLGLLGLSEECKEVINVTKKWIRLSHGIKDFDAEVGMRIIPLFYGVFIVKFYLYSPYGDTPFYDLKITINDTKLLLKHPKKIIIDLDNESYIKLVKIDTFEMQLSGTMGFLALDKNL